MKYRDYKVGFSVEVPDYFSEVKEASFEVFGVSENTLKYFILLDDEGEVVRSLSLTRNPEPLKTEDEYIEAIRKNISAMEELGYKVVYNNALVMPNGREVERVFFFDDRIEEDVAILAYFTKVKDYLIVSSTICQEFYDDFESELLEIFNSIEEI